MRTFIAINYSEEHKNLIYQNVNILRPQLPKGIKWVEKENLHITFKFLGDTSKDRLGILDKILKETRDQFYSFPINFGQIQVIPNHRNARILWYNMVEKTGIANNIFRVLERRLVKENFKKAKRPLHLHTTLGRIRYPIKDNWEKVLAQASPITNTVNCSSLTLFKSKLTPKGPIYSIIEKYRLNKK